LLKMGQDVFVWFFFFLHFALLLNS